MNRKELEQQLLIESERLHILKGNWTEHFKADKELSDMYGGKHWRAERIRKTMNEIRAQLDEQQKKAKEIEEKLARM